MRKEVLFAILAGLTLGLIIAFGIYRANVALSPKNQDQQRPSSPTPKPEFVITLASPSDLDVFTENPVTLSGITKVNAYVAVSTEEEDYITRVDSKGSFEVEVELVGGVNQLVIVAFDEKGSEVTQKLLLVFSTEFAKYVKVDEAKEETQNATDSVRDKVQQKVSQALKSPRGLLGTVTDILENTLQIKSGAGEIEQLSVSSETSVLKTGKTPKEVKLTDVAIGDYIVAMGFKNGNGVLDTKRILISSPIESTNRRAIFAKVFEGGKKYIISQIVKTKEDQKVAPDKNVTVLLLTDPKTAKIKFADLKEEDLIVALGEEMDNTFSARTIFVVKRP
ncbi:hypothetical protein HY503_00440 [Candidatus Woesebacteria bacterium]|nr:hypothetical protein [Candidatus Woesebacteria bacterium]